MKILCTLALLAPVAPPARAQERPVQPNPDETAAVEHFEAHVRPLLAEHCIECHSGDKPKGDLRLDTVEGLRAGAAGEPIFVAGDLENSLIVEAVRYEDPFTAMPPDGELADDEVRAIERWIELGAHLPATLNFDASETQPWCFQPPVSTEPASGASPGADLVDAFLLEALAREGVEPSPAGSPRAWLRRVTFDLTGLPPTPEDLAAFLADATTEARERAVDRLLASPAFGERWARRWLDLVRYAETKAHEFDYPIPNAYRYRDYVIRAFNADVPYDRFITEFLAGDLVETARMDPTGTWDESILGTGAWQLGEEVHSPVEPRGDQTDRIANQVEVLSKSVMALGAACARCHDHKFDPISAEDYHALAGFALSTAPRQVRYESNDHNLHVARSLATWIDGQQITARNAVADALEAETEGLDGVLAGARTVTPPEPYTDAAAAALDAAFEARGELRPCIVLEDFEGEDLEHCSLSPWVREGEAFIGRPVRREDIHPSQPTFKPRGRGAVNSYAGHPDAPGSADAYLGTLTSAPFTVIRSYLHFRVNGGDEPTVRVELIDAETGEALIATSADRTNTLTPARFDLEPFQGRRVRIRFVDEHEGGWGQIGGDHFVLSDEPGPEVLDVALPVARLAAFNGALGGADLDRLLGWIDAMGSERFDAGARRWMDWLDRIEGEVATDARSVRELVRYAALSGPSWITNGPGFGPGPRGAGEVVLDLRDDSLEVAGITSRPAAVGHPTWADLEVVDSSTSRGSSLNWVQAGRTLVSPEFDLEHGRVAHLVRGEGRMLMPIASHKLVQGPLHGGSTRAFDTEGEWRWVIQDVPSGAGLSAHLELTATGRGPCEIAATVEVARDGALPAPLPMDWVEDRSLDELEGDTPADRARFVVQRVRDAAELVRTGGVEGRALSDGERSFLYGLAEFMATEVPSVRARVRAALAPERGTLAYILHRRVLQSRLAPAALELEGRDERVLDRGSWQSPLAAAPRRLPSALRSDDAPLARDAEGSGRLAFAEALLGAESAIVQRVWVNRTWQALFGKGIVETTDDFGAMGAKPTHPELLDRLVLDFAADGWSTKRLLRRLVLTDAYGRSTRPTASAAELDPSNRLLAHMAVRRLEAEEVRDTLLAASGELDRATLGAPVPIHLTPFMSGRGRPGRSGPEDGGGRRSIYIEVRRNFPHPLLTVFDQPTPSTCHGRRTSANVPAQALAMLNDPFVEARAVALAEGVDRSAPAAAVEALWLQTLARRPSPQELEQATAYVSGAPSGDLDPWVDLAHTLFNTKEFLFLE